MLNEEHKQFNLSVGQKIKSRRLELKKNSILVSKKNRSNISASAEV